MPRKPRQESPTGVYRWITCGINRKTLFHFKDDYLYFLDLVRTHAKRLYIEYVNQYRPQEEYAKAFA
jgi:hypothetical protein